MRFSIVQADLSTLIFSSIEFYSSVHDLPNDIWYEHILQK